MNENNDLLEERFALFMSGEPLEVCLQGLTQEETELVRTAVSIQAVQLPLPAETAVAEQRQMVLAAADQLFTPLIKEPSRPFFVKLQAFFNTLQGNREIVLGLAFMLLVIFFFAWFSQGSNNENEIQTANLAPSDQVLIETDSAAGQTTDEGSTSAEMASAEVETNTAVHPDEGATAVASQGNSSLYIPVISMPLLRGPEQAAVHDLRGLVEVQTPTAAWTAVTANINIPAGSRIRSAALSGATISFYDGSQAHLGPQSELSIDQLNAQLPETGFRTIVMTQWQGISDHQVQFRNDGGSLYEVKGETGSGIARGTEFRVDVGVNGRVQYTVHEGKVDVTNHSRTVPVTAGQTTSFSQTEPPVPPSFLVSGTGVVTQMGETWIIAGQPFIVTDSTQISGNPQIGDRVHVEGHLNSEGLPVADTIYKLAAAALDEFSLTGIVEAMQAVTWLVSGQMISISLQTEIEPNVQIGDTVQVIGTIQQPDGALIASQIQIVATAEGLPFEFTGIVQSIGASEWIISGITLAINEETALAADIGLGDTVKVEGLILADDTWLALEISLVAQDQAVFSFTGEVLSMTPWLVAGISFDVAEWTLIEPGIEVGDRVRVEGVILADGSWLAAEITLLSTDILQITFVGEVTSINPWVINGLPIQTNDDTVIEGDISVGDLVQVTVWIRNDGTWLASHIKLLAVETGAGCVWLTAVVNSINDSQIILANGQTIILDENLIIEGELSQGSVILVVACVLADGTIDIISITVIFTPPPPPPSPPPPPNGNPGNPGGNTTICHKPGTPAEKTKTIPNSALGGHLGHGDTLGACGR